MIKIENVDCIEYMKGMDSEQIDLTVTSPPYDSLRSYKESLDWNFDIFKQVAYELFRVTKDGGVVVWNVSDAMIDGSETGTSFKQALHFMEIGFKLHDTMIYQKPPRGAVGSKFAYWQSFEYMFVFVKGKLKTFNPICDRKNKEIRENERFNNRSVDGDINKSGTNGYGEYGRRTNVWMYFTGKNLSTKDDIAFKHPAIFPEKLAEDHILSWSNKGDVVFDPFSGSGTTAKMCYITGRNFIGCEKVKEYYDISIERINSNKSLMDILDESDAIIE